MDKCGHYICFACLELKFEYINSDINFIGAYDKCIICYEKTYVYPNLNEDYINFCEFLSAEEELSCPKCQTIFFSGNKREVVCYKRNCNFTICKVCLEEYHEDGDCEEVFIEKRIRDLQNLKLRVAQCPRCRLPYAKNYDCNPIKCCRKNCRTKFMFCCASLMSPIFAHGYSYHRPDCHGFFDRNDYKFEYNCEECLRLGRLCEKPQRLRNRCLVAKDEV